MDTLRVLIVDDDLALLQALPQAIALRMKNARVDTTDSAQGALQQTRENEYDAIVSDIKMPDMDGITMIERLRDLCPDTPTLLITGHGERDLALRALRVGAYDFIQKPIDRDYFISSLQRAIQTCRMRRQIATQQRELEQYTRQLEQIVAERTRELVEANAAKDIFMSMVSHELKTPLTTLKGTTQMLARRMERGDPIEMPSLNLLEHSVRRMERLVNDLLNTSLIETGMFSLDRQPDDLVKLLQELLAEHREAMGSTLHIAVLSTGLICMIDRERISQAVLNLLSNAHKYSRPGSPVLVKLECEGNQAVISVHDHGVGIQPEKLAYIFERFYRVPEIDVQTGSSNGVGLGLYIARKIIERHDGSLHVASTPGQGSTFTITLPLCSDEQSSLTSAPRTSTHAEDA
jgi:signal transduction histidine kinase